MLLHWYKVVVTGGKQYSIIHDVMCLRFANALKVKPKVKWERISPCSNKKLKGVEIH